ncbi:kinase-like domain-containing protein [Plectosphaerella cucumerina]|uniref:Kinase-like domain-containing protein n=1 Tax=Plectosphaerella cucumerina TaxID=40658 RepID=A0A8K0X1G3_9PEZI|nr:kinase-like domain-containing protein [Plectosphaerella cucumerina]
MQQISIHPESSFFKERQAGDLPSPAVVRATNIASGHLRASYFNRPPPVKFPSLGLVVKYGADVTITEARTQKMVREQVGSQVSIPEVFGWAEDEGQGFIYMSLIQGETLCDRWGDMSETERRSVCAELKSMATAWRALPQGGPECFIGSFGEQPLNDIFLNSRPKLTGPFRDANAVQDFQRACGIEISHATAVVFTHDDLVPPNILLSPGPKPKVAAVIDWAQAGWYPGCWEFCKARRVRLKPVSFSDAIQAEWQEKYLPMILDSVDETSCYHPWLYFVLSKGI